jgi:hypothetical protein
MFFMIVFSSKRAPSSRSRTRPLMPQFGLSRQSRAASPFRSLTRDPPRIAVLRYSVSRAFRLGGGGATTPAHDVHAIRARLRPRSCPSSSGFRPKVSPGRSCCTSP